VPRIGTTLCVCDTIARFKARWGIGRMKMAVRPGLHRVGNPDAESPVLVTANYRMTFDRVRVELSGLDAWLLVLDTRGINVWCAAGKGTFGTSELIRRVREAGLAARVSHRVLVLPQLGAPGVAAHAVQKETGFRVKYGPVSARHIRRFLADGMKIADPEMRRVHFGMADRLALAPMEIVPSLKWFPAALAVLYILRLADGTGWNPGLATDAVALAGALFAGTVAAPALLPWIPGRAFSLKGWLAGLAWAAPFSLLTGAPPLRAASDLLLFPAVSAFLALNFTGSSTYTSLSGVKKEMRVAVPAILASLACGVAVRLLTRWIG
jgi:hypothetical protein